MHDVMVASELRYLRNIAVVFCGFVAVIVVSIAIRNAAHLGVLATTAVSLVLGGAALFGAFIVWIRRQLRAGPAAFTRSSTEARYLPIVFDIVLLGWVAYNFWTECIALHTGEHVSRDLLIINGALLVWLLIGTICDVRKLLPNAKDTSPFSARKLAALTAAYEQPTRAERRRALAPLRIRGFARLALIPAMLGLFFVFEPRLGAGVAMVGAFAIILIAFVSLHKLIDL